MLVEIPEWKGWHGHGALEGKLNSDEEYTVVTSCLIFVSLGTNTSFAENSMWLSHQKRWDIQGITGRKCFTMVDLNGFTFYIYND